MKKHLTLLLAALAMAVLSACGSQTEVGEESLRLWFAAPAERQSREVTQALGCEPYEGAESVSAMLAALLAGPPADSELASLFPRDTRVVRAAVVGRTARVELSGGYAQLSGVDQTIADYCIALTLCQLPGVTEVEVSTGESDSRVFRVEDVIFSGAEEDPAAVQSGLASVPIEE